MITDLKPKKLKVLVLFVQYCQDTYPSSKVYLQKYLKNITCEKEIIVIDNKITANSSPLVNGNIHYIGGNNAQWEFSGWDCGIKYAKENNIEADVYLFVNDSFLFVRSETFMFHTMSDIGVKQCVEAQTIVGDLIKPPVKLKIGDRNIAAYIRSHCFLLPASMVASLKSLVSTDKILPMSRETKNYIDHHLLHNWHRKKEKSLFLGKTIALLNEILLSARIEAL